MVSRSLVLGYHGCEHATAQKIVAGQDQQIPSANDYDWLGSGFYFWEDSPSRALLWAQNDDRGRIKKPAVLGAIIDLGNCLNLIDTEHLDLVKTAHKAYLDFCAVAGSPPAQNKGKQFRARYLDRAVFETLHRLRNRKANPLLTASEPFSSRASLSTTTRACIRSTTFKSASATHVRLWATFCHAPDRFQSRS